MKKIRFSLPIILAVIAVLNLIQFVIGWDTSFLSSFFLFGTTAVIFYYIIYFTTDRDGFEK
jgi:ABC-type maltose transport system permease subunit